MTQNNNNNEDNNIMQATADVRKYAAGSESDPRLIEEDENGDSDITRDEKEMLEAIEQNSYDTDNETLQRARLDNKDEDGELLNEKSMGDDVTGDDLDVPGSEEDDYDESIGEEDEENNSYSASNDNE